MSRVIHKRERPLPAYCESTYCVDAVVIVLEETVGVHPEPGVREELEQLVCLSKVQKRSWREDAQKEFHPIFTSRFTGSPAQIIT